MSRIAIAAALRRRGSIIALLWTGVAIAAAAQTVAVVRLGAPDLALGGALLRRLAILPLWAAVTPAVLGSARWLPLRGVPARRAIGHALAHLALGTAFVVTSNLVIRLPFFVSAGVIDFGALARDAALGVATYYPGAMLVYGTIVAAGHALMRDRLADGQPDAPIGALAPAPSRAQPIGTRVPAPSPAQPVRALTSAPSDTHPIGAAADAPVAAPVVAEPCLTVKQWNRVHLVRLGDIDWIEAEDNYVVVHAGGRALRTRERIGALEAQLDPRAFVRIHRSTIVPVARVREVQPLTHGDHAVILRDGRVLRVSRSRRDALAAALGLDL